MLTQQPLQQVIKLAKENGLEVDQHSQMLLTKTADSRKLIIGPPKPG